MITTRILGKKVTGKNMYECLVKALGFFPKVNKETTLDNIEQQAKPKISMGNHVDKFINERKLTLVVNNAKK